MRVVVIVLCVLLFTGCAVKSGDEGVIVKNSGLPSVSELKTNAESGYEDEKTDQNTIFINMNIYNNKDGIVGAPLMYEYEVPENGRVSGFVGLTAETILINKNEIPLIFYVLADDELIPYSVNGEDETLYTEITTIQNEETFYELEFTVNPSVSTINVVAELVPDVLPEAPDKVFTGWISYSIKNSGAYAKEFELVTDAADYVEFDETANNSGIEIGCQSMKSENSCITETLFFKEIDMQSNDLYIKYHEYEAQEDIMVILVLVDGRPVSAFGDKYTKAVSSVAGIGCFQHKYTAEEMRLDMPEMEEGIHTVQTIACSINNKTEMGVAVGSYRNRIIWK